MVAGAVRLAGWRVSARRARRVADGDRPAASDLPAAWAAFAANLGQVRFTRAWRIDAAGWRVVARFDDGSAGAARAGRGTGTCRPLRVGCRSSLERLSAASDVRAVRRGSGVARGHHRTRTGGLHRRDDPADVPAAPGVHRLASGRLVSVNVDPRESSPVAVTATEFDGLIERTDVAPPAGARSRRTDGAPAEPLAIRIAAHGGRARGRIARGEGLTDGRCRPAPRADRRRPPALVHLDPAADDRRGARGRRDAAAGRGCRARAAGACRARRCCCSAARRSR